MVREESDTVRETTVTRAGNRPPTGDEPNPLFNALVGAVVTVLTAPLLPFAAIFGGGVAGYLRCGELRDGAEVGALAGAIAAIPVALLAWLVVSFLLLGGDPLFGLTSLFAFVVFVAVAGYLVGAGALGGALGSYLRREL